MGEGQGIGPPEARKGIGEQVLPLKKRPSEGDTARSSREPRRWVALSLTVLLGPFGAHRLYLGTETKVPIVYALTLGGGLGVLPLIDLVHFIITPDLSRYQSNGHVFMWKGEEKE